MKFQRKGLPTILVTGLCSTVFLLLRYAKISPIIGSCFSFFSLSDVVMPLSVNLGFGFVGLLVALRFGIRTAFFGTPFISLVYHIPGIFASGYWAMKNKLISLVIPLICMVAFLAHPIGFAAAPYCLYWLIPMGLFFVPRKTIFMHCLASTFIAHSIGSVIWLYSSPMPAAAWIGLIPVVAIERFVFASGMTAVYTVCTYGKDKLFGAAPEKTLPLEGVFND